MRFEMSFRIYVHFLRMHRSGEKGLVWAILLLPSQRTDSSPCAGSCFTAVRMVLTALPWALLAGWGGGQPQSLLFFPLTRSSSSPRHLSHVTPQQQSSQRLEAAGVSPKQRRGCLASVGAREEWASGGPGCRGAERRSGY